MFYYTIVCYFVAFYFAELFRPWVSALINYRNRFTNSGTTANIHVKAELIMSVDFFFI